MCFDRKFSGAGGASALVDFYCVCFVFPSEENWGSILYRCIREMAGTLGERLKEQLPVNTRPKKQSFSHLKRSMKVSEPPDQVQRDHSHLTPGTIFPQRRIMIYPPCTTTCYYITKVLKLDLSKFHKGSGILSLSTVLF